MHLVTDHSGLIVAAVAHSSEIGWFDGYGVAPGGVSILGPREAFEEVDADLPDAEGPFVGRRWADGALSPVPAPEVVPEAEPLPEPSYELYKTDVISRMTDAELDAFDEQIRKAPTRERRMWADCTRLVSDAPYFEMLKGGFATAFGVPRATALLAKE